MKELLLYFDWTRVAMFYTDDKTTRKCLSVAQGAFKHFPIGGIHIVLFHEIDRERPTDEEIDAFLNQFPSLTRSKLSFENLLQLSSSGVLTFSRAYLHRR